MRCEVDSRRILPSISSKAMQSEILHKEGGSRRIRKSYEAGHRPKFLVLIDETDDCGKAVYYASRRAVRLGARVSLLRVIDPPQSETLFLGVAEMMKAEAEEDARQLLARWTGLAQAVAREQPETLIEQGDPAAEIFKVIEADEDMAMLVLAAGSSQTGPGPLIAELGRTAGTYPLPVVIVPAHLSDDELDALS
jgi:nucleotide-binding universal stress UspA family protein